MAQNDEERTEEVAGEATGEPTPETAGAESAETASGGEDPRDEQLRLMREENERLRQEAAAAREARSTEGRAEAHPTTTAPSHEQAFANEAREIDAEAVRLMEKEAAEGQTVESIRAGQKLIERKQRLSAAVMAHALRRTELNTFVATLPKDEQAAFREFARTDGHRYADLEALYDGFEIRRERTRRGKTTETVKRAEDIIKRNDQGRVSTVTREVTAAEAPAKRAKMTGRQFDEKFAQLEAAGDHEGMLALSRRVNTGELEVDD